MMSETHLKQNAVEAKVNARICVENNLCVYIYIIKHLLYKHVLVLFPLGVATIIILNISLLYLIITGRGIQFFSHAGKKSGNVEKYTPANHMVRKRGWDGGKGEGGGGERKKLIKSRSGKAAITYII